MRLSGYLMLIADFINYTDNNSINGSVFVTESHSCTATGSDENGLANTCAYHSVNRYYILVGDNIILNKLNLKELATYKLLNLICGDYVSYYFSF